MSEYRLETVAYSDPQITGYLKNLGAGAEASLAQDGLLRDVDAILSRLETNITHERTAIDALLLRLNDRAVETNRAG